MKKILSTIALVCAVSAGTAFAQDPSSTPAGSPSARHEGGKHFFKGGQGGTESPIRETLESLTPEERQKVMAARQKAEADPAVAAARQNAETAMKAAHEAMQAAMLKADPTLGPILDKLNAALKEARPEGKLHHFGGKGASESN